MSDFITRNECINNHQTMIEKIDKIDEKVDELALNIASLPEKMAERFDQKYASKPTEWIVYGMVSIILISVFTAILYSVVKSPSDFEQRITNLESK